MSLVHELVLPVYTDCGSEVWGPEVLAEGFDHAFGTTMSKDEVVPDDGWMNEGGRKSNAPCVVVEMTD